MKRIGVLVVGAIALICGCQMMNNGGAPSNEWEREFLKTPCCQTTYALVGEEKEAAVPLILATLDRLSGETNVEARCSVIQGALYDFDVCLNTNFATIIRRGTNDPSPAVRAKTTNMVGRATRARGSAR